MKPVSLLTLGKVAVSLLEKNEKEYKQILSELVALQPEIYNFILTTPISQEAKVYAINVVSMYMLAQLEQERQNPINRMMNPSIN